MSTKKQAVAELLYDLPTNKISTDLIKWIMSHLPEDNTRGTEATKPTGLLTFDHSAKGGMEQAIGFTTDEVQKLSQKLQDSFPEGDRAEKSVVMEAFYPKLDDREKALIISYGVPSFMQEAMRATLMSGKGLDEMIDGIDTTPDQKRILREKIMAIKELIEKLGGRIGGISL